MKIGVPKEYRLEGMSSEIERLWALGAEWLKRGRRELLSTFQLAPHALMRFPLII